MTTEKKTIHNRLNILRSKMEMAGADACLIPMGDFHASEYKQQINLFNHYFLFQINTPIRFYRLEKWA